MPSRISGDFFKVAELHRLDMLCLQCAVKCAAIARPFDERAITQIAAMKLRSDNGTRFVCSRVERPLDLMRKQHEHNHPQTAKEDAHIESFNAIL